MNGVAKKLLGMVRHVDSILCPVGGVGCLCELHEGPRQGDAEELGPFDSEVWSTGWAVISSQYAVATVSRIDKIIGLFCRISYLF